MKLINLSLPRKVIVFSLILMMVAIFTSLPAGVFGSIGVLGTIIGWLFEIKTPIAKKDDNVIDVDFEVSNSKPVGFDEKLRKLSQLKDDGIITEEEFNKKRKEFLKEKW